MSGLALPLEEGPRKSPESKGPLGNACRAQKGPRVLLTPRREREKPAIRDVTTTTVRKLTGERAAERRVSHNLLTCE